MDIAVAMVSVLYCGCYGYYGFMVIAVVMVIMVITVGMAITVTTVVMLMIMVISGSGCYNRWKGLMGVRLRAWSEGFRLWGVESLGLRLAGIVSGS